MCRYTDQNEIVLTIISHMSDSDFIVEFLD